MFRVKKSHEDGSIVWCPLRLHAGGETKHALSLLGSLQLPVPRRRTSLRVSGGWQEDPESLDRALCPACSSQSRRFFLSA